MLFVVVLSCSGHAAPNAAAPALNCAPAPVSSAEPLRNSTKLQADPLDSPLSKVRLQFATPELGEHVMIADPRSFRVTVSSDALGPDVIGLELGLDAARPRRLSVAEPTILLGELLSADVELGPGAHWLFAAPVLASGLVPRAAAAGPRAAQARRFFVGKTPDEAAGPSGAVWLRKPEGSYNGTKNSQSLLFEAFVFSALGAAIDTPCTITLRSPAVSGQLQLASPFVLREVPSGLYEVTASALGALTSTTHFTVNRELAGGSWAGRFYPASCALGPRRNSVWARSSCSPISRGGASPSTSCSACCASR